MGRTCGSSGHRERLLRSQFAVCYYCSAEFSPTAVVEWTDEDVQGIGQTATCPYCSVDAVVGFDGPVDRDWLAQAHVHSFGAPEFQQFFHDMHARDVQSGG